MQLLRLSMARILLCTELELSRVPLFSDLLKYNISLEHNFYRNNRKVNNFFCY